MSKGSIHFAAKAAILCAALLASSWAAAAEAGGLVTLAGCLEAALASGAAARRARADLALAEARYAEARAGAAPAVAGSASAGRDASSLTGSSAAARRAANPLDTLRAGLTASGPATSVDLSAAQSLEESPVPVHTTAVNLSARQTLWDGYPGGRGRAALRQAELTLQAARLTEEEARRTVVADLTQAYYAVLAAQSAVQLQADTVAQRREELARVQALVELAAGSSLDLLQARVNLTGAEVELLSARDALDSARARLSSLAGWPVEREYTVAEAAELGVPKIDAAAAAAQALEQRLDLRRLRLTAAAGEIALVAKRAERSPVVSVSGGVGWLQDWTDGDGRMSWNADLSVSVPVYDAGLRVAQARQAELANESVRIQAEELTASITAEVRDAAAALRLKVAKAELARRSLELAQANYDVADLKLSAGAASPVDLLDASVKFSAARAAEMQARWDLQLAILSLQAATGEETKR